MADKTLRKLNNNDFLVGMDGRFVVYKVPEGVTAIDSANFCAMAIDEFILPQSMKLVNQNAFYECRNLKHILLSDSTKEIEDSAFCKSGLKTFIAPKSLKKIGDSAFKKCRALKDVQFNDDLEEIGDDAFEDCEELVNVNFNKGLKSIGSYSFLRAPISKVVLPDSVEEIGEAAFYNSLVKTAVLPANLAVIKKNLFASCDKLSEVTLPRKLEIIGEGAFLGCPIGEVNLPDGLRVIDDSAFNKNASLTHIEIPDSVKFIGKDAFGGCDSLQKIKLSKNLEILEDKAFGDCVKLKEISLPEKIERIYPHTFENCVALEQVELGPNIKIIDASAFQNCQNLSHVDLPEGLETIDDHAFECSGLKEITLPKSLKKLGNSAFAFCDKIKKVTIQENIDEIGKEAFAFCGDLEEITFGSGTINDCFLGRMPKIKCITISPKCKCLLERDQIPWKLEYITKVGDDFKLTSKKLNDDSMLVSDLPGNIPLGIILLKWDKLKKLEKDCYDFALTSLYSKVYEKSVEDFIDLFENGNLTFYKQIIKEKSLYLGVKKLFYDLGGFKRPFLERRTSKSGTIIEQTVDYSQKVGEFFKFVIQKYGEDGLDSLSHALNGLPIGDFKKEFTDFLIDHDNFDKIMKIMARDRDFITKCYVNFENVQVTNKSHKGSQRQLKPTVERFENYFKEISFTGVTNENRNIAKILTKFYEKQENFDDAEAIRKEKAERKTANSILGFHLTEASAFDEIDELSKKIKSIAGDTLDMLQGTVYDYKFDWLEKDDPYNYVLGLYCDCCAHLDSQGYGIMHASIVDPNVQNLVIRLSSGEIVAKSTLYVNREGGYGIFNNISISEKIPKCDHLKIYTKFKLAAAVFAQEYNRLNPQKPLRQLNIGMRVNSLSDILKNRDKKEKHLLKAIDYSTYGKGTKNYNGDSATEQIIVWEDENNTK